LEKLTVLEGSVRNRKNAIRLPSFDHTSSEITHLVVVQPARILRRPLVGSIALRLAFTYPAVKAMTPFFIGTEWTPRLLTVAVECDIVPPAALRPG
jgi:hypothetical protein